LFDAIYKGTKEARFIKDQTNCGQVFLDFEFKSQDVQNWAIIFTGLNLPLSKISFKNENLLGKVEKSHISLTIDKIETDSNSRPVYVLLPNLAYNWEELNVSFLDIEPIINNLY